MHASLVIWGLDVVNLTACQVHVWCRNCRVPEDRRRMLTNAELKAEFGDLLTWRDSMFAKHYPLAAKA